MPFQGNPRSGAPDPQFLQFLFNRQDARAKAEQQAATDKLKAAQQFEDERRKNEIHRLDMAAKKFDVLEKIRTSGAATSEGLQALDGRLQPEDLTQLKGQGPAGEADQFANIMQQNDPAGVAEIPANSAARTALSNDIGELARMRGEVMGQGFGAAQDDILGQSVISERTVASDRQAKRDEARKTKELEREFKLKDNADAAAEKASERGEWKGTEIDAWRNHAEKRLGFMDKLSQDRRAAERLDPTDPIAVIELVNRFQKRIDEGAAVREGDIALARSIGASGAENFLASVVGYFDKTKTLPPKFGKELLNQFASMLDDEDVRAIEVFSSQEEYAGEQGWSEKERRRALPFRREARMARERVAKRKSETIKTEERVQAKPTREEYDMAARILSTTSGRPVADIPVAEVGDLVRQLRSAGAR